MKFSHLHNHTQYSLLDGASDIKKLYKKAVADEMPALAITDHGNMFGVYNFVMEAKKHVDSNGNPLVKPIIGCEFYLVEDRRVQAFSREKKDKRYHQLFLAKNKEGYKNLIKLCTLGFTEGLYSKYPRIDKELVQKYHKGLIASTCCLGASVPKTILEKGEDEGEKEFKWWLDIFGEDFYVEFQRHGIPAQDRVNKVLQKFSEKYNVPMIASNDSHYLNEEDANSHDLLLCINTGEKQTTPVAKDVDDDEVRDKNARFGFFNNQFYLKSTAEMTELFKDIPQAIDNTNDIVSKVEHVNILNDLLLPNYKVPDAFNDDQDNYLEFLTYDGAKARYKIFSPELESRLQFELGVIKRMGFAGYFLIVSDIIRWSKNHGVFVGSGRGSAAGSVVAYCIGITNIDPMQYNLLFERFLNPDRKSMPDIDTDFDDEGRSKVINYIVEQYGKDQVAQIITHNSMAAKMSIKDVARAMDLNLSLSNELAKLVPEQPGISLRDLLHYQSEEINNKFENPDWQANIYKLQTIYAGDDLEGEVLREAEKLEGTIRNTGIHAAGILIGPKPLDELMPMCRQKDIELNVTQFDGSVVENVGAIKIDVLGLSNLTILKQCIEFIKENHNVDIVLDEIPLDDAKTFELYQQADTFGTFQFASQGMRNYLRQLKPDKMEDLIALNALFRPGPIKYIPDYIDRKHGRKEVLYDVAEMEEILSETYGITVYQEQVMRLSQKLANFSPGDADLLRKAMGKKQKDVLDKMKQQFVEGCTQNGHALDKIEKIWTDWEAFAQYAFNKSHSTCYAYLAYQTAYLKANYPAEYMTALLNSKSGNIESLESVMSECKKMGLMVLGPHINKSKSKFSVSADGEIRFGLSAIKNVGEAAVNEILKERKQNGVFKDIFSFVTRVSGKAVNKKTMESLADGGAFDDFPEITRSMFFHAPLGSRESNLDMLIKYGNDFHATKVKMENSLFGETGLPDLPPPKIEFLEEYDLSEKLRKEKDVLSFYVTAHPLDNFLMEMKYYNISDISDFHYAKAQVENMAGDRGKEGIKMRLAGYLTQVSHLVSKVGNPFGKFVLNDFVANCDLALFKENYLRNKHYLQEMNKLMFEITIKPSWKKENPEPFVQIDSIILLSDVKNKLTQRLSLFMNLDQIDEQFMTIINKYAERSGKVELGINIVDNASGKQVQIIKNISDNVDELIHDLSLNNNINFSINN